MNHTIRRLSQAVLILSAGVWPPAAGAYLSSRTAAVYSGEHRDYGSAVAGVGDVNGDGFDDIVIGDWFVDAHGPGTGRAYIYFGSSSPDTTADVVLTGEAAGDQFGLSVGAAGDVNDDGFADVIVGARNHATGGASAGRAYIYFGGPAMDATPDWVLTNWTAGDWFGHSVSGAGDVNGDGFDDVIVGAPLVDRSGKMNAGSAYVYFGGTSPDAIPDLTLAAGVPQAGDQLGTSVSGGGDMNGDGFSDVVAGAWSLDNNGPGFALVLLGGSSPDSNGDLLLSGQVSGDRFGVSTAFVGDVDHDGTGDLLVGAEGSDAGGQDAGRAYLYFGSAGLNGSADRVFTGQQAQTNYGHKVAGASDVNGDGSADFLVSAGGRVDLFLGGTHGDAVPDLQVFDVGGDVGGAGDVDGDGWPDVVIGTDGGHSDLILTYPSAYQVLAPNGGEILAARDTTTIRWMGVASADIWLSLDAGATWEKIAARVGGFGSNALSLTLPVEASRSCRIRVGLADQPVTPAMSDASDGNFWIRYGRPIVVAADGSGDVTSVAEGISSVLASQLPPAAVDTLIVMPGTYDEVPNLTEPIRKVLISAPGGPDLTHIRGFTSAPEDGRVTTFAWTLRGMEITDAVDLGPNSKIARWERVRFASAFSANGGACGEPNLFACELHGPVRLLHYVHPASFDSLRFVGSTLYAENGCGKLIFRGCRFEGCDTAAVIKPNTDETTEFQDCAFTGVGFGVMAMAPGLCSEYFNFIRCRFVDVGETALLVDVQSLCSYQPLTLTVTDSRFERCGSAVRWVGSPRNLTFDRDTILETRGIAIEALARKAVISRTIVRRSQAAGCVLDVPYHNVELAVHIAQSEFAANGGPGLVLRDSTGPATIEFNTAVGNAGNGFELYTHDVRFHDNLAHSNRGDGIRFEGISEANSDSLMRNTSARNDGAGMRILWNGAPSAGASIENNLLALNAGEGIVATPQDSAFIRQNDSWSNLHGAYVGFEPNATNLLLDPQFCGVALENYSVRNTSPCAPSGPYGPIGAFGVGCNASTVEVPIVTTTPMLRILSGNPARGAVTIEYGLPPARNGRLEAHDISGRLCWRRSLQASGGRIDFGLDRTVRPGIYLLSLVSEGTRITRRVALLR